MKLHSANRELKAANACSILAWVILVGGIIAAFFGAQIVFVLNLIIAFVGFSVLLGVSSLIRCLVAIGIKNGSMNDDIPDNGEFREVSRDTPLDQEDSSPVADSDKQASSSDPLGQPK